ncbi:SDR family NAD(P)-dependent oxidoreductase, partial [Microbacterium lushaniae]
MREERMGKRGQVVVVVGASRGIGRAAAYEFARRGDRVVVVARDEQALARTAEHCRTLGAETLAVPADVTDSDALGSVVRSAVQRFGRIDAWIGVAGVLAYGTVEQTPTAVYRRVLETNLIAQIDGVRQVLPVLRAQGSGRIVLIGSLYSRVTAPYVSAYAASKFGLLGFAGSLR